MRVVKYYCDRCGKETRTQKKITLKGEYSPSLIERIFTNTIFDTFVIRALGIDYQICLDCYNEFRKWVEKGK